jgi:hypothetical protein
VELQLLQRKDKVAFDRRGKLITLVMLALEGVAVALLDALIFKNDTRPVPNLDPAHGCSKLDLPPDPLQQKHEQKSRMQIRIRSSSCSTVSMFCSAT